ncbi:hypothetical protein ABZ357_09595 [Streptomyces sp. NPDC005917]|uniref:hypothetical protein n=1 Tax=unclassified Streptomyces TaxID=2593676 RepID=UPI0033D77656
MTNRTHVPAVALGTAGHLPYAVQTATRQPAEQASSHPAAVGSDGAREHTDHDAAATVAALTRECQKRGITLEIAEDTSVDLTLSVNGVRTLVGPFEDAEEALDEIRLFGRCIDCRIPVGDTCAPYAPGHRHIDGSPIMICQACRDRRAVLAADPARLAFSRALDAIETAFKLSKNPGQTRSALVNAVAMYATDAEVPAWGVR